MTVSAKQLYFCIGTVAGALNPAPNGSGQAKELSLDNLPNGIDVSIDDSNITSITEVSADDRTLSSKYAEGIYDLSGRKVLGVNTQTGVMSHLPKEVYIVNSKKMIIR